MRGVLWLAALVACGTRTGLDVELAPDPIGNGCADETRDALFDKAHFPRVAACAGACAGTIDGASALALCSSGWHVCRGSDKAVRALKSAEVMFPGCYAYDAAQDCNYCSATCRGIITDPKRPCTIFDDTSDADMAGLGTDCIHEPPTARSCLSDIRLDASQGPGNARSFGCRCDARLTGVVCCAD
jgi:hypothetical protein